MQIDLTGRTALITGASKGLGLAMARRLASSRANVVMLARGKGDLETAAADIPSAHPIACDITDEAARDAAIAEALDWFGTIDILVNNAGSSQRGPIEDATRDRMIEDMDLKLYAPLELTRAVLPGMKAQRWGRVLNVTAVVGKAPNADSLPTSVSRGAGITMTKALSRELAPWNILVNALCVGKIKSGQWERRFAASGQDDYENFLKPTADTVPLKRLGEAEEFANVACFLASDAASYVTGTAINVDGGLCAVT